MAEAIYDHFEGVPMAWTVSSDELQQVKGIGKGRAEKLIKVFGEAKKVEDVKDVKKAAKWLS